jgi:hypothetical protein
MITVGTENVIMMLLIAMIQISVLLIIAMKELVTTMKLTVMIMMPALSILVVQYLDVNPIE